MPAEHLPVLLEEVVEALNATAAGVYVDGTFGRGGHTAGLLSRLDEGARVYAFDRDPSAAIEARDRFPDDSRLVFHHAAFSEMEATLSEQGVAGQVAGIVLDLGVSSPQLDDPARGFSFLRDGPLDMRMDPLSGQSAADWLAQADAGEISWVLRTYGEERFHRRIAHRIIRDRAQQPIESTCQLAEIIAAAVPRREPGKHPATRSFQAIRIHVNRELEELSTGLQQAERLLAPGGRLAVISFHSLEDRIVKRFIRDRARGAIVPPEIPILHDQTGGTLRSVGKPRRPTPGEIVANPRSRSAVLRVAEKLP